MQRRTFLNLALFAASDLISGCFLTTKKLHQDPHYQEIIFSVLVTEDGKNLIILGDKYHYLFENQTDLIKILRAPFHSYMQAELRNFHVDTEQMIRGNYYLVISNNVPNHILEQAMAAGFKTGKKFIDRHKVIYTGDLTGKRYSAENFPNHKAHLPLNQSYIVKITEESSITKKAAKLMLTPVTLTADGLLTLFSIPLFYIVFGVLGADR